MNILLIVDPQNDFISGTLSVKGAYDRMDDLVDWYKSNKDSITETFITMDTHPINHCSFKDNGGEWPQHCVDKTEGWEIYPPLSKILENDSYYFKGTESNKEEYSIFENKKDGLELLDILKNYKYDDPNFNIYVAGIAGDYCVLNTIKDLIKEGFKENLIILPKFIASIDGGKTLECFIGENQITYKDPTLK